MILLLIVKIVRLIVLLNRVVTSHTDLPPHTATSITHTHPPCSPSGGSIALFVTIGPSVFDIYEFASDYGDEGLYTFAGIIGVGLIFCCWTVFRIRKCCGCGRSTPPEDPDDDQAADVVQVLPPT